MKIDLIKKLDFNYIEKEDFNSDMCYYIYNLLTLKLSFLGWVDNEGFFLKGDE